MIRTALAMVVLAGMIGCAGDGEDPMCQPIQDGYYDSPSGVGYTISGGLPLALRQFWSCAESACGTYTCTSGGASETISVSQIGDGQISIAFNGDAPVTYTLVPPSCNVPLTSNTVYQDCGGSMKYGIHCVEGCGELPQDGSPGVDVGPGCTVQIGTSVPLTAMCVSACSECH